MLGKLTKAFNGAGKFERLVKKEFEAIKALEEEMKKKSFEDMQSRINEMRDELNPLVDDVPAEARLSLTRVNRRNKFPEYEKAIQDKLFEFLPEVYAMLNEVYRRLSGNAFHDVQLKAGIILAKGQYLIEQYTGEGKTRTFQLPLTLYSLVGRSSMLITVNDYLCKVGGEYAGHFLSKLGITTGIIAQGATYRFVTDEEVKKFKDEQAVAKLEDQALQIDAMDGLNLIEATKREAYNCDVTYGTNNEVGFDYLRDNMASDLSRTVMKELYFCVIDEADSILIDEARTPLIISGIPVEADTEKYSRFADAVKDLEATKHYEVDYKSRSVALNEEGQKMVEQNLGVANAWDDFAAAFHIENALKAKALFNKDEQYTVRKGEVLIVDEFTGRTLAGRRYSEGLHQAIEAKEGVDIQQESKTFATITFQNFFRLYKVITGGSGTIMTESEEFFKIYGLDSIEIPTNKPRIREDSSDRIFKTEEAKFNAVIEEIREVHDKGRPILVGTTSVDKSEVVSKLLDREKIAHSVLNAKQHEQESRIVAEAGKRGAVTVATNMAGRGTDIVIGGGSRGDEAWEEIVALGGLHVIGTERHDSRRIDNQLRGRTGRQGEPGSTRFYVSLGDNIMRVMGGEIISRLMGVVKVPDNMPIENRMISKQIETAQKRVEGVNFDGRKRIVEYDDVMNQHREVFYSRRMNMLGASENAAGKFVVGNRVLDLNLPENKDKLAEREKEIDAAKEKVEDMIEKIVMGEVNGTLETTMTGKTEFKEDDVDHVLARLESIVPARLFPDALEVPSNSVRKTLITKFNEEEEPITYMRDLVQGIFDSKQDEFGANRYQIAKALFLGGLDQKWVDHLELMKDVRGGISLQGYAQRNPLVEYKNKAFEIFSSFISNVNRDIAAKFFGLTKVSVREQQQAQLQTNTDQIDDVNTGSREFVAPEANGSGLRGQGGQVITGLPAGRQADNLVADVDREMRRNQANLQTNAPKDNSTSTGNTTKGSSKKEYGRNDRVSVEYDDGRKLEDVKYKKVQADVEAGVAKVVS